MLATRVAAEGEELARHSGPASPVEQAVRPLNRAGTRRFLRESRRKVWFNAALLNRARGEGPAAYQAALFRLETLTARKVATLQAPGQVLLRLAARGFGVRLDPRGL